MPIIIGTRFSKESNKCTRPAEEELPDLNQNYKSPNVVHFFAFFIH